MNRISCELGRRIAEKRRLAGLTQRVLADRLTEQTGETVSVHMVSSWQRGIVDAPASILPVLCRVLRCSSWSLYPHSQSVSDVDVLLIQSIKALDDDEKDDLYYLLHDWKGDRKALLKMDVAYAAQDKAMRYSDAKRILSSYTDCVRRGAANLDTRPKIDIEYLHRAIYHLLDDEEE